MLSSASGVYAAAQETAPASEPTSESAAADHVATPAVRDAQVENRVQDGLQNVEELSQVQADVKSGVATLTGEVAQAPQREQAGEIAQSVDGVRQVDNAIDLDPDVTVRFSGAMQEANAKLMRMVAHLPLLIVAALIVLLSMWLGRFLSKRIHFIKRVSNRNPYMDGLARNTVRALVTLGGILLALDLLGATSLVGAVLGSAGVVGLVLGFAFKDIAENYIAGVLLSLRRPFNPGDLVRIDSHEGRVVALTSRTTQLMTLDGNQLQLPNSLVFKSVMLNFSRNPKRRFEFTTNIGVSKSWSDAMDIGIRAIRAIDGVLADPAPSALIRELADAGATLQFFGWIDQTDNDLAKTRSEAMRMVRRTLREHGITPPDAVQRIAIARAGTGDAEEDASVQRNGETAAPRDTSVDRTLDEQLQHAEHKGDSANLLHTDPPAEQTQATPRS